jgi:Tfp pilus assembly protein PilF
MPKRSDTKEAITEIPLGAKVGKIILIGCALLILIHLAASFFPHLRLWGINQLGYFSMQFRLGITAVGLLILIPRINGMLADVLASVFARVALGFKKVNKYLIFSGFSLLGLIFFWLLRSRTPLLGDGYLRAGELKMGLLLSVTEPLDFYLHLLIYRLLGLGGYTTYALLSCIAGAIGVFLILLLCDVWGRDGKEKVLIFSILATMGSIQLFFGYVESYSFMFVALLTYVLFGLRYLKGMSSFLWPSLFFLLAVSFHLTALFVLPSLVYLAFSTLPPTAKAKTSRVKFANAVVLVCIISLIWGGLHLLKTYALEELSSSFLIYPFGGGESFYSFFSPAHILDFLNHLLLVSPVSLVLWIMLFILFSRGMDFKENTARFLTWIMVCSLGLALLFDPKLGYARDWDLFACTGLGITFLGLYLALNVFRKDKTMELNRMTLALVATSLVLVLPWIGVNASPERSIERFEDLLRIDHHRAAHGYETLACYFRDKGEHEKTIELWKKAIAINPIPRYYAILGNAYLRLKRYDEAIEALEQSIRMSPHRPGIQYSYRSLGICLVEKGRLNEAVAQLEKAISLDPGSADFQYVMGNILGRGGRYQEAVPYFERALQLEPGNFEVYKLLGIAYARMGKKEEAERYLKTYLQSAPQEATGTKGMIDSIQIEMEYDR